jgi:hypothetical protein
MKMENIKMYEEFDQIEWDDELKVPRSVIEGWINGLKENEDLEDGGHNTVIDDMQDFLDDYYTNDKIDAADPDEIARKHAEDIEPEEDMTGAAADEDPTLIKKFEE